MLYLLCRSCRERVAAHTLPHLPQWDQRAEARRLETCNEGEGVTRRRMLVCWGLHLFREKGQAERSPCWAQGEVLQSYFKTLICISQSWGLCRPESASESSLQVEGWGPGGPSLGSTILLFTNSPQRYTCSGWCLCCGCCPGWYIFFSN